MQDSIGIEETEIDLEDKIPQDGNGGTEKLDSGIKIESFGPHPADGAETAGLRKDGTPAKKRGPKPGTKYKARTGSGSAGPGPQAKPKVSIPVDNDLLATAVYSIHSMLAANLKIEELAISKDEAEALTTAIVEVQKQFDVVVSPKTMSIINLGIVMSGIYGTRILAYSNRMRSKPKVVTIKSQSQGKPDEQSSPTS